MAMPAPSTIFVDVDNTLLAATGIVNEPLIEFIRQKKSQGCVFVLWSMRGKQAALDVARYLEIEDCFDAIVAKPSAIIDDFGWQWVSKWNIKAFHPYLLEDQNF